MGANRKESSGSLFVWNRAGAGLMKKQAFIFPGLNGLLRRADRNRFLPLPEVQERFRQAEAVLSSRLGHSEPLMALLEKSTEEIYSIKNISLAAVIICAIQTGVTDRLKTMGIQPAWVMGCSLGDLARAVFAGAYRFEDAVYNHVHFTRGIEGIESIGRNIGVASSVSRPFDDGDYAWFDEIAVDVSRLTPRFLNVGGRHAELSLVEARAREKGWHVMPILEYPAHSRYILPFVDRVSNEFENVQVRVPQIPIFSSFSGKPLTDPVEIRKEFLLSITQTIHWHHAVTTLVREHGITEFVNIGPCRSLSRMMGDIPGSVGVVEADALISN
jgi:[acyl-carrier-protein] S-malonyltransferase